jgi:RNA polymerase sigma factor (sigma-70 family)
MGVETWDPHISASWKRDALICDQLPLVDQLAKAARRRLPRQFELEDLIEAGRLGLVRAATRYRPKTHSGTPFAAFARPAVWGAIRSSVRDAWSDGSGGRGLRPLLERLDAIPEPVAAADAEDALDARRTSESITRALAALPAAEKGVLQLVYSAAAPTIRAAAAQLGIPAGRAYRLRREGIAALRCSLSPD